MHTENEKNRGYQKIEGAVHAFNFDFLDKTVLDIGSSTGGFTEIALENGAKKVIAVEKGTNQMKTPLRFDSRIELHEKTDIFNVKVQSPQKKTPKNNTGNETTEQESEVIIEKPDVIIADVSFLSLTKILSYAKKYLSDKNTEFLVMLKPQFEAKPNQLNKGIVKNEKVRREIIKSFEYWLKQNNFIVFKKRDNDLHGRHGNIERFYYLKKLS